MHITQGDSSGSGIVLQLWDPHNNIDIRSITIRNSGKGTDVSVTADGRTLVSVYIGRNETYRADISLHLPRGYKLICSADPEVSHNITASTTHKLSRNQEHHNKLREAIKKARASGYATSG